MNLICSLCLSLTALLTLSAICSQAAPYRFELSDDERLELATRLNSSQLPDTLGGREDWSRGIPLPYLNHLRNELVSLLADAPRWAVIESQLNADLPQHVIQLHQVQVHYALVEGTAAALPVLFIHGWPGSFLECRAIAPLLTRHGCSVVCASLPGFGLSELQPHVADVHDMAKLFIALMHRLFPQREYLVQGGDWGGLIARHVALQDVAWCKALHVNFVPASALLGQAGVVAWLREAAVAVWPSLFLSGLELQHYERLRSGELLAESGYLHQQATKPDTLAVALMDSPVGLLAWMVEKLHGWSRCRRLETIEGCFSLEFVALNLALYWRHGAVATSLQVYYEHFNVGSWLEKHRFYVTQPTAAPLFPDEMPMPPSFVVAAFHNLQQRTPMPSGGHFAALEEPQLLADDVVAFAKHVGLLPGADSDVKQEL